ncbi:MULTISPECIES: DUF4376 domain-containing protein [unclassified Bradyrhizobium]|uniref:DUF4376 domain-containing protein n=1 Tax=unclassified Bradyrhizobium TaxID=2631580 RepID=UPI002916281E|nr:MULTISPECIES: DUF4376 domain-containing protein [unclassified Bradyrhizobium]
MREFDIRDWYWMRDDGSIFSSAKGEIVSESDPDFVAWTSAGGSPSNWPRDAQGSQTTAALQEVLTPYGLFADMVAYANAVQWARAVGGYQAVVGGKPVTFSTSTESMGLMVGKVARLQQANPPASVFWQVGPVDFVSIPATDFPAIATAVADFVQSTFDKLSAALAAIAAGTITTRDQVDAALA